LPLAQKRAWNPGGASSAATTAIAGGSMLFSPSRKPSHGMLAAVSKQATWPSA
jgi:hypothetical protein